tara:strand:- start:2420 stop:2701 length:282 start_codon:yes stop_codon:yes gene_type:complete
MKLIELMQRADIKELGLTKSYLKSAFIEIQSRYPEKVEQGKSDLVKDQRFYTLPPVMVDLLDVRAKWEGDDGIIKYRQIPRIRNVEDVDQDGL